MEPKKYEKNGPTMRSKQNVLNPWWKMNSVAGNSEKWSKTIASIWWSGSIDTKFQTRLSLSSSNSSQHFCGCAQCSVYSLWKTKLSDFCPGSRIHCTKLENFWSWIAMTSISTFRVPNVIRYTNTTGFILQTPWEGRNLAQWIHRPLHEKRKATLRNDSYEDSCVGNWPRISDSSSSTLKNISASSWKGQVSVKNVFHLKNINATGVYIHWYLRRETLDIYRNFFRGHTGLSSAGCSV